MCDDEVTAESWGVLCDDDAVTGQPQLPQYTHYDEQPHPADAVPHISGGVRSAKASGSVRV